MISETADTKKGKTALLIIDMQDEFLSHFTRKRYEILTERVSKAIQIFKKNNAYIVNITFKNMGELDQYIDFYNDTLEKDECNAFSNPNLDVLLKNKNIKTIVPAGVQSFACVKETISSAQKNGYEIFFSPSLVEGYKEDWHLNQMKKYKKELTNIAFKNLQRIF